MSKLALIGAKKGLSERSALCLGLWLVLGRFSSDRSNIHVLIYLVQSLLGQLRTKRLTFSHFIYNTPFTQLISHFLEFGIELYQSLTIFADGQPMLGKAGGQEESNIEKPLFPFAKPF